MSAADELERGLALLRAVRVALKCAEGAALARELIALARAAAEDGGNGGDDYAAKLVARAYARLASADRPRPRRRR